MTLPSAVGAYRTDRVGESAEIIIGRVMLPGTLNARQYERFGATRALDGVSLAVPRGSVFGLVGPNGSRKTTLIKHVLGLLRAQTGSVRVFGRDPVRDLAAVLLYTLPDVIGVELLGQEGPDDGIGRLLVRARNTRRFFEDLNRLVLEEWYDIVHLETLDDSTQAVLGYLLGGKG